MPFRFDVHALYFSDDAVTLESESAHEQTSPRPHRTSSTGRVRERVSMVRSFARYLQALDPAAQLPPTNLVAAQRRPVPYLFTSGEIAARLAAATTLSSPLRAATYRT